MFKINRISHGKKKKLKNGPDVIWSKSQCSESQKSQRSSRDFHISCTAATFCLMIWSMTMWKTTCTLAVSVAVVKWWYTALSGSSLHDENMAVMWRAAASTSRSDPGSVETSELVQESKSWNIDKHRATAPEFLSSVSKHTQIIISLVRIVRSMKHEICMNSCVQ